MYATISKNNQTLFKPEAAVIVSKEKKQASALKGRVQLHSSLYIGCKLRQGDLDEFFRHENREYPTALSDYEKIRKPTVKSDFLKHLHQENGPSGERVSVRCERSEVT